MKLLSHSQLCLTKCISDHIGHTAQAALFSSGHVTECYVQQGVTSHTPTLKRLHSSGYLTYLSHWLLIKGPGLGFYVGVYAVLFELLNKSRKLQKKLLVYG